ncbi:MAG: helicase-associated domain-containing protein [Treponema sp.]|jgi:hypothetical protein|nr:helicase-associated domain-containing protein [Treponema sp.]
MKDKIFRSVEFWKSAVMTMPDNSFFELMRSVFGKIKTPFKKQQLINDLEKFLLREDIQKTIAAYIDQNDAKVIAAAALFGEPAPGELESFFSGEFSYAQLQDIIVNLEERFILYRFAKDRSVRLALNPLLENALAPFTADTSSLFPAVCEEEGASEKIAAPAASKEILNGRILAGLLSFVSNEELFFRAEGVIRKRILDAGKACFNNMDLPFVLGALQILGLFYVDGDKLVPDKKRFEDFGSLPARERGEYCAAALIVYEETKSTEQILPPLFKGRIREISNFIHSFLDSLDAGQKYHEKSLMRLAEILKAKTGIAIGGALPDALEKTGLLVSASPDIKQLGAIVQNTPVKQNDPVIAVDSGFSVIVYPEITFTDAVNLAAFMNILEAGAVVRFELTKDSAVRAFNNNIRADEIIDLLKRLSGGRLDDSLIWHLKDWEKRHGEVSLKNGVILSLSEDRRYLTKTMPLAGLISETLAPGIYLLPPNAVEEAAAALSSAGIDIISRRSEKSAALTEPAAGAFANKYFPPPEGDFQNKIKIAEITAVSGADKDVSPAEQSPERSALTQNFHAILKKMPMGEFERAELSARIDRRMVLCETQLKEASLRYEKLEARNMDYAGKQNIAKQAIAQRSPVEIVWPGGGKGERVFGIPKALEKDGGDIVLVIVPAGGQDELFIPLGKISLLRRIKKSIFEV